MTTLALFTEIQLDIPQWIDQDNASIAAKLSGLGIDFAQWPHQQRVSPQADSSILLEHFQPEITMLNERYGFQSIDVVNIHPEHPQAQALRQKFLAEHTHDDFEVRYFVAGQGLFYLHLGPQIYLLLCTQGDLISVPARTTHWFDMGAHPHFTCIRFFTRDDGWVGQLTGNPIAGQLPDFDQFSSMCS